MASEEDKQRALAELRSRIADILPQFKSDFRRNDVNLMKFLIARDFKVDKAEEMIRKTIEWRQTNDIDNILLKPVNHDMDRYYYFYVPGFDKEGHPVVLLPVGRWDPFGAFVTNVKTIAQTLVIQFCEQMLETFEKISDEEKLVTKFVCIFDCGGFDYKYLAYTQGIAIALAMLRENVQMLVNYYPEIMFKIFVVNAPSIFTMAWSVVRPLLTARSISKIHVFGTNRETWKKKLLEYIDPDNLPSSYGGANTTCLAKKFEYERGVWAIPELEVPLTSELVTAFIEPGKSLSVCVEADEGEKIQWKFKTLTYDISFGVFYAAKANAADEVVIGNCRVDSHQLLQKGTLVVERAGKYIIKWDNSYSVLTRKELKYCVAIAPAGK